MRSLTVREEIAAICSLLLSIQHEQGALEGERLHDYRVVLRRLSVILPLMIPQLDDTKELNAALHRLRIAVKKVRYLCQWLELISGQPAAMLTPLTAWQQRLGALSDLQLVRSWLVDNGSRDQVRRLDGEIRVQQQGVMAGLGELHLLLKGALALSVAAQNSGYFFHQLDSQ